jgi:hypothetical protein
MLHREERGGGKGQLEEAMGQLTARLEGFIYSFQAGKRRTTLRQSKISTSAIPVDLWKNVFKNTVQI